MLFKTYQKLLGASCLALCLVGCGGDSGEPLVGIEIEENVFNSTIKIISKTDNIEIQDLKLNRGNCEHDENFLKKLMQERANAYLFASEKEESIKNHQARIAGLQKDLEELTQWVQPFNSLDKFWENMINAFGESFGGSYFLEQVIIFILKLNLNINNSKHDFDGSHDPIFRIKKLLSFGDKPLYSPNVYEVDEAFYSIRSAIEDTKNPKDYPYINLKELKKIMDSIVDDNSYVADGFFNENEYHNGVSEKGLQSLAKLKSMWSSVGKFYFAYLKEAIPRHAKEVTDKMISSEEKSIKANQVKLTEAKQDIDKMEELIKDLESKKNTMVVDLKFGETFTAHYKCQNLIEVEVKTDKGSWTFNFDR
ncbi:hypothetical protein [Helicobacter pylori]|uniref:hypothetical protein n=1 Tax=Helicobacter pylori TaxID=210 RepID=UPI0013F3A2B1|nr:hypothetical protein [Helicobacter pylori]NHB37955.1 hypothetical protein [Helicobacter pylori]NHB47040.1 hypothetical protein [Helicobacter pylori]NHB48874.1 hypothetical protein [Helicobacter pylori]